MDKRALRWRRHTALSDISRRRSPRTPDSNCLDCVEHGADQVTLIVRGAGSEPSINAYPRSSSTALTFCIFLLDRGDCPAPTCILAKGSNALCLDGPARPAQFPPQHVDVRGHQDIDFGLPPGLSGLTASWKQTGRLLPSGIVRAFSPRPGRAQKGPGARVTKHHNDPFDYRTATPADIALKKASDLIGRPLASLSSHPALRSPSSSGTKGVVGGISLRPTSVYNPISALNRISWCAGIELKSRFRTCRTAPRRERRSVSRHGIDWASLPKESWETAHARRKLEHLVLESSYRWSPLRPIVRSRDACRRTVEAGREHARGDRPGLAGHPAARDRRSHRRGEREPDAVSWRGDEGSWSRFDDSSPGR